MTSAEPCRHAPDRHVPSPAERPTPGAALDAFLTDPADPGGPPNRVRPGAADLVLLHAQLRDVLARPSASAVQSVPRASRLVLS